MKNILAVLIVALALPIIGNAQDATYLDTLDATGITSAGILTRGYDVYVRTRTDINDYQLRTIKIDNLAITDSVKIQGGMYNSHYPVDTTWEDLEWNRPITRATPSAPGYDVNRDTLITWLTDVGWDEGDDIPMVLVLPHGYDTYRVVSGKLDSGVVFIRYMLWEGDFGAIMPGAPELRAAERPGWNYAAVYFEHQRA